jgi:hypothetical protein
MTCGYHGWLDWCQECPASEADQLPPGPLQRSCDFEAALAEQDAPAAIVIDRS